MKERASLEVRRSSAETMDHGLAQNQEMVPAQAALIVEILESTTDSVIMLDRQWCFIYLNSRAQMLIGRGKMLLGTNIWNTFAAASTLKFWSEYHRAMDERVPTNFVEYHPAPLDLWLEVHAFPTQQGISIFFRDVTAKRTEESRLRLLDQAVEAAPMGISVAEVTSRRDCPLIYVNPAFERLTGYSALESLGADCRFLQGSDLMQEGLIDFRRAIEDGQPARILVRNYKKDGQQFLNEVHLSHVYDESGRVSHIVGIQNDVTEQLEAKDRLARQAQYDALTGLANRYRLIERLEAGLQEARKTGGQVAVAIVDLDNFKHMNDRFGHFEADRLLIQIARRLHTAIGPEDTAARLGGDEFAFVLVGWPDQGRLQKQMEKILYEIKQPLQLADDQELMMTGSAGVAIAAHDAFEAEELLQMADLSMYWVKRRGKNSFRFYSPDLRANSNEPLDVAVGFRRALVKGEFELFYQPRVSAESHRVKGFEALIRWRHPERGLLLPAQFVRIAEDTGLINEIGQWALEEALKQNALWRQAGLPHVLMSVNISPAEIRDPEFPRLVAEAVDRHGLPPESLELELTESLLIDNAELADTSLQTLKQFGVRIAIDDFGAGYSGLHYLSRFPVDTIKIDYHFTRHIATNETAATICHSIMKLGKALGLNTVAEGVENETQAALLCAWSCSELQGHMFAKALPSLAAREILAAAAQS